MNRESNGVIPAMSEQISFWDEWNLKYRNTSLPQDEYNAKQLVYARNLILKRGNIRTVLEVGCGTGWLSAGIDDLAAVTGTDLSPGAIQEARNRQSRATFLSGDILDLHLDSRFDMVISTDTMAHIPDHSAFITKLASLLNPGGILLLMTQNPSYGTARPGYLPYRQGSIGTGHVLMNFVDCANPNSASKRLHRSCLKVIWA